MKISLSEVKILNWAFDSMPNKFTSNQFSTKCCNGGIPQYRINAGILADYLHKKSHQSNESKRIWFKKNMPKKELNNIFESKIETKLFESINLISDGLTSNEFLETLLIKYPLSQQFWDSLKKDILIFAQKYHKEKMLYK